MGLVHTVKINKRKSEWVVVSADGIHGKADGAYYIWDNVQPRIDNNLGQVNDILSHGNEYTFSLYGAFLTDVEEAITKYNTTMQDDNYRLLSKHMAAYITTHLDAFISCAELERYDKYKRLLEPPTDGKPPVPNNVHELFAPDPYQADILRGFILYTLLIAPCVDAAQRITIGETSAHPACIKFLKWELAKSISDRILDRCASLCDKLHAMQESLLQIYRDRMNMDMDYYRVELVGQLFADILPQLDWENPDPNPLLLKAMIGAVSPTTKDPFYE